MPNIFELLGIKMKRGNPQVTVNHRGVVRVPDQNGEFMAPNISGDNHAISAVPGLPEPFTPEWDAYMKAYHAKHNPNG